MTTGPGAVPTGGLLDELEWRGILHAVTPGLAARLASGRPIAGYNGFDPTADSMHVGHLIPIFGLLRLQRHGGRPIVVIGGGTGMIGDPSGRSSERNLLDRDTLEHNVAGMRAQFERYLDFSGDARGALLVNNLDWLGELSLIDFLRDTGKHFTVPYMLAKDSVQTRLERGLSFTEFSYMLLQSFDFWHLHRTLGVELQLGGADQWGNITAGLELIRRASGVDADDVDAADMPESAAHGLAYKLLLAPSGEKFGKSMSGESVWLDPARTTPFAFYQYWLNLDDRDVGTYLRWFTEFDREQIEALDAETAQRPEARGAQRALARDITTRTHGEAVTLDVIAQAEQLFSGAPIDDPTVLAALHESTRGGSLDRLQYARGSNTILAEAGLVGSKSEGRRLISSGGVRINGQRVTDPDWVPDLVGGSYLDIRIGKRRRDIVRVDGEG